MFEYSNDCPFPAGHWAVAEDPIAGCWWRKRKQEMAFRSRVADMIVADVEAGRRSIHPLVFHRQELVAALEAELEFLSLGNGRYCERDDSRKRPLVREELDRARAAVHDKSSKKT